jgi:hypothetical protein
MRFVWLTYIEFAYEYPRKVMGITPMLSPLFEVKRMAQPLGEIGCISDAYALVDCDLLSAAVSGWGS